MKKKKIESGKKIIDKAIKEEIIDIFGQEKTIDDDPILLKYGKPDLIVQAEDKSQIIKLIKLAVKNKIPLIPKSSKVDYYDGAIPENGGILLDMSNMKKILNIREGSDRCVTIQPGVNYEELQKCLNERGYKCMVPLGLPCQASVLSSYLERTPLLSGPRVLLAEGSQCIMDLEVIRGDGTTLHTGSASTVPSRPSISPNGPIGPDWTRVFTAAQGTMGIVTEMTLKFKHIPNHQKILLKPYDDLEKLLDDIIKIKRMDIGKECIGMSNLNLAAILAEIKEDIDTLKEKLPKWTMVLNITGFDEEELKLLEEDLKDLNIQGANDDIKSTVAKHDIEEVLLKELNLPNKLVAHRDYKENCHIIPFYARKSRVLDFNKKVIEKAKKVGYNINDLYGYVMPIEQARIFYFEFTLYSDSNDSERIYDLFKEISEFIIINGGIIDRPYGIWRKMIYSKIPGYTNLLRQVKGILDPKGIFNPGKIIPTEGS
ncbi:MAG: FAD-binding oxidoreductase [Promethearchaeota archaeon]